MRQNQQAWTLVVVVTMTLLALLILWTVLVVDPHETVGNLGSLYHAKGAPGWFSLATFVLLWLSGVVLVTLIMVRWGGPRQAARSRVLLLRQSTVLAGGAGITAAISAVIPGFPLGLGFYTLAEELGTAPLSGSISNLLAGISLGGCLLLGLSAAGLLVHAVASRHPRGT